MAELRPCEFLDADHVACTDNADWQIVDLSDFDPTTCVTLACRDHLSDLIGHHTSLPDGVTDAWELRPCV